MASSGFPATKCHAITLAWSHSYLRPWHQAYLHIWGHKGGQRLQQHLHSGHSHLEMAPCGCEYCISSKTKVQERWQVLPECGSPCTHVLSPVVLVHCCCRLSEMHSWVWQVLGGCVEKPHAEWKPGAVPTMNEAMWKKGCCRGCAWPSSRVGGILQAAERNGLSFYVVPLRAAPDAEVKIRSQIRNCPEHSRILSPCQHGTVSLSW